MVNRVYFAPSDSSTLGYVVGKCSYVLYQYGSTVPHYNLPSLRNGVCLSADLEITLKGEATHFKDCYSCAEEQFRQYL